MLINKILFLEESRDAGLPLRRALSNLWDGSNKARLCGWEAREGEPKEKIFWRSAPLRPAQNNKLGILLFFPLSPPHYVTLRPTAHWAATAAPQMSGDKMDSRDLLELQVAPAEGSREGGAHMHTLWTAVNVSPYTRRSHTRPQSHPGTACHPPQLERARCRSCILPPGSWENKVSRHLHRYTHTHFLTVF